MASRFGVAIGCVLALVFGAECGRSQTLPQVTEDALHAMSLQAGVIFTGQVVSVRRNVGAGGATGVVEIEFAVEDAVRGVSGSSYTLREWAGLWPAGDEPFRVGQTFLMLLHATGAAGFSSPVGGTDGAIPIRGGGDAWLQQAPDSAVAGSPAVNILTQTDGRIVDLRWVQTRVVQPLAYSLESPAHPTALPTVFHADEVGGVRADVPESATSSQDSGAVTPAAGTSVATQGESYAAVLTMLRGWEK